MILSPVSEAARRIRSEYLDLPGLSLTRQQVCRLYALDGLVCDGVLDALVDVRFLERTRDGRYVRASGPSTRHGGTAPAPGESRSAGPAAQRRRAA